MYRVKETQEIISDPMYIMPDQWVNDRVVERIRTKYPLPEESKCLRLGVSDVNHPEFVAYNTYVEECRQWGKDQKAIYCERAELVDVIF